MDTNVAEQIRKMMKVLSRGEAAAPTITHSQKELWRRWCRCWLFDQELEVSMNVIEGENEVTGEAIAVLTENRGEGCCSPWRRESGAVEVDEDWQLWWGFAHPSMLLLTQKWWAFCDTEMRQWWLIEMEPRRKGEVRSTLEMMVIKKVMRNKKWW